MKHRLVPGLVRSLILVCLISTGLMPRWSAVAEDLPLDSPPAIAQTQQQSSQTTQSAITQEFRRINNLLVLLNRQNDSLRARIDVLERNLRATMSVIPQLRTSMESVVEAKTAMDSLELAMINQMSLINNKIRLLEDKAAFIDSTNFEILTQLVLLENKIVSLTSSFNEVMAARQTTPPITATGLTDEEFRDRYVLALTSYQNGQYREGVQRFLDIIESRSNHELSDNAQYWLAECYYAMGDFKQAINEFQGVFNYPASEKVPDAQYKIALSYWNIANYDLARNEFQKVLNNYPGTDVAEKARRFLQSQ